MTYPFQINMSMILLSCQIIKSLTCRLFFNARYFILISFYWEQQFCNHL